MSVAQVEPEDAVEDVDLRSFLLKCIHPEESVALAHLALIERDIQLEGTKTLFHCYAPTLDGNGRVRIKALAEFLRDKVLRFVVPRRSILAAEAEYQRSGKLDGFTRLYERAKRAFVRQDKSGEGGELLLYALAEKEFGLAQILCKMSLKTSPAMHYHGADGIYASASADGQLNLFWGESKVYAKPAQAIAACLASLGPHLRDESGGNAASASDVILLNEYADLGNEAATKTLRRFLDPNDPQTHKLRICGIALVAFNDAAFPISGTQGTWAEIEAALRDQLPKWRDKTISQIGIESLETFDIHFICVPMGCVNDFRKEFLECLGGS